MNLKVEWTVDSSSLDILQVYGLINTLAIYNSSYSFEIMKTTTISTLNHTSNFIIEFKTPRDFGGRADSKRFYV